MHVVNLSSRCSSRKHHIPLTEGIGIFWSGKGGSTSKDIVKKYIVSLLWGK